MYLNYSNIEFDSYGRPEQPELVLQTLDGTTIGVLNNAYNLQFNIKYSELSELRFSLPAYSNGMRTHLYDRVTGYKLIYTKNYGVYLVMNPVVTGDGIEEVKEVRCYSIEKELDTKNFFLEEGTFNFWNPASPSDTILGRILELSVGWSVGEVSPSLVGRYRTFDSYSDRLLSFIYNNAPEKYRCAFVFDPYQKTISAYDLDVEAKILPIYLDFDNLVEQVEVSELTDDLVTALSPFGSDQLDIRAVNPIGSNWIYDISHFISTGDIPSELAEKWDLWQASVIANQEYYTGLISMRSSASSRMLVLKAELIDLQGELQDLTNQQSVIIQQIANKDETLQDDLDNVNKLIDAKNKEITDKESEIQQADSEINNKESGYTSQINAITARLSLTNPDNFTPEEYNVLAKYFIEQDITENTFVATSINSTVSGSFLDFSNVSIIISDSQITEIGMSGDIKKTMYTMTGGSFIINGDEDKSVSGDVIRGTLDLGDDSSFVMSLYAGTIKSGDTTAQSGMVSLYGSVTEFQNDVKDVYVGDVVTREGTQLSLSSGDVTIYMTANVSEYQKYSVQMELYDYAKNVLKDLSSPTYEFSIDSANFLFSKEFSLFKDSLRLGNSVYLKLHRDEVVTPRIIEFEFEFEDWSKISLVFSNQFKRRDNVNTFKDMVESSYSSGRNFESSKYIYNQAAGQVSMVSDYMQNSLDAAKQSIHAATNNSVVIDGAGIHIGGESDRQIRIVDSMIAMTDDRWQTAKLAIGNFVSEDVGDYWGINADLIGGKLIIGNNLVLENETDDGVMQFKVDSTGAWLNNSTFVLQKDSGGKIIINPAYGIVAGTSSLFDTNGTVVTPSFIDENGDIVKDNDGFPQDTNFYLDIRDGTAYFRGTVQASSGSIGGWTIAENQLYSGSGNTYVALNSSGAEDSLYAIWAGDSDPAASNFYVKRDGTVYAKNGTFGGRIEATSGSFSGELSAVTVSGNIASKADVEQNEYYNQYNDASGWLLGCGIDVGNGKFIVDQEGNVTMSGSISWGSDIVNDLANTVAGSINIPPGTYVLYHRGSSGTPSTPTKTYEQYGASSSTNWHTTYNSSYDNYVSFSTDGGNTWGPATLILGLTEDDLDGLVPEYIKTTYIDETTIYGPHIYGGRFYATGEGQNNGAAFYITELDSFNASTGEVSLADPLGWLSWDTEDGVGRVILKSTMNPLKLQSGTNMSLQAGVNWGTGKTDKYAKIYIQNPIAMTTGTMFGTTQQMNSVQNPVSGQLFFVVG